MECFVSLTSLVVVLDLWRLLQHLEIAKKTPSKQAGEGQYQARSCAGIELNTGTYTGIELHEASMAGIRSSIARKQLKSQKRCRGESSGA